MNSVTAKEISAKFNSKSEFHWFLVQEMGAYLPKAKFISIYHLRDLMSGDKKVSRLI